jgi:hypothetical protein
MRDSPPAARARAYAAPVSVTRKQKCKQGTFGALLLRSSSSALGLNRGARPEDLEVTPVAGVEEGRTIDAPLDGELVTNREA